jgi:ketosteroid isomerase-like protein
MILRPTVISAIWLAGSLLPAADVAAQSKVKIKDGVEQVRDKSKPIRAVLEAQYAKIAEAYRHDDPEAVLELRTPDFSVHMPNGELWDADRSAAYVKAGFEQVKQTLDLSFTIGDIDVHGDTAAAVIHQRWSRTQMKGGRLRRVDTGACQRETWIDTPGGWRLHLIDSVQPLVWSVDGKRVDPGTSYDPDAPVYVPDVDVTSPCTAPIP